MFWQQDRYNILRYESFSTLVPTFIPCVIAYKQIVAYRDKWISVKNLFHTLIKIDKVQQQKNVMFPFINHA